ncbi:MATE family efflux transporter, partial [Blautia sp. MSK22_86]
LGSTAVASVTAAGKISMFCCCPFDALGSTMATYAGQNVGAKKMDRVNTGILTSSIIGSVYSVVILGVMFLWSRQISLLFVDASETVILDQARQ